MEAVIAVLGLLFVAFVVLGALAAVRAVGAAKRGVDRTITQARRTVEDHTLRAKSYAQLGPAGELAQLRLRLRTSMRATQDALNTGVAEDESLRESLGLFQRLSAHGHELDGELRALESEPDRARLRERLPGLRERTQRVVASADSLRWAARDRAVRFAADDLDTLSEQIDLEAGALRHWTTAQDPAAAQQPGPSTAAPRAPRAPQSPRSEAADPQPQHTRPGPSRPAAEERTRPSITPPSRRPAYPWQKKPRPESTT
ncbi:hypothetical protein ACIQJX_08355 [Streptomyces griseoviridis]